MVDRQFTHQNGLPPVLILPSPALTPPPPEPKWVSPEANHMYKKVQINDNMSTMDRVVLFVAEFAGTAILVLIGCMGCANQVADAKVSSEQVALTFGLAVMISVQIFGHISGCHINPAVTVAAVTLGNIPLIQVPIFIIGQMLGGLAGFGLIKAVTPIDLVKPKFNESVSLCSPSFNPTLTPIQAMLVEFLLSLMLVLVCCAIWDSRNDGNTDSLSIRLGLTVAGLAMAGGPYTGANINPARSFGPALINGDWDYQWVYWVGPLGAGFVGALFYRMVFLGEAITTNETSPEVTAGSEK
ncbi:hypothetical protein NQ317_004687 [Molorchus minor]|uniref:Uncharacterized protein n=1 Tax=Molorchus minor TaxID=1323400 RepID=A0ABQ9JFA9_9CUCU|nr:hypothetical protein NQ317_004687 [Molorchus minor]